MTNDVRGAVALQQPFFVCKNKITKYNSNIYEQYNENCEESYKN